ncbi:MAG: 2-dehydropantoate 2-reductase [Alphaproteobacteria bacterium]|nr:2-dehydropantoate 2-reductase [Alphaproteobacteria bacterium]
MRFAIFGAGGMGAYFGGKLALAGHEVAFIARGRTLDALRAGGLRVDSPDGDFAVNPVTASDDPTAIGQVDAVLFCVKLYDVVAAKPLLASLLGPQSIVLTLQNGVEVVDMLAPEIARDCILPGASYVSANIVEPGLIRHVGTPGHIDFGELSGTLTPRAQALIDAFAGGGIEARFKPDITASLWAKFVLVAAFSGVMGLVRAPIGVVRAEPACLDLLRDALQEAEAVGRAMGINIPQGHGDSIMRMAHGMPPHLKPSLLEDLEHGRRLEVDWLSGGVVRLGEKAGVSTPVHRVIHAALKPHANGA